MILLGVVLMLAQWRNDPTFFRRKPYPVDPELGSRVTDREFR
jgi:hypothetical protein